MREAGGLVSFHACAEGPLTAPLDVLAHSPIVCARTPETLATLSALTA